MNNSKPHTFALYFVAVGALLVCASVLFPSKTQAADEAKPAASAAKPAGKPALTVTTVQAQSSQLPINLSANGNLAAWQEAIVGAETNGLRLSEVRVNVGDAVKKGQVLAVFAADTLRAEMAQTQASLAEANATAAEATANAERARSLQTTGALSAQQINQYVTAEITAKARVQVVRAQLQAQNTKLAQTELRAPDAGIISARMATLGAVPAAGMEMFRLIRQGRLEWRAEVTAKELGFMQPGTPVTVLAASGATLTGKVRMVGPSVDPQTRAALVYVDVSPAAATTSPALNALNQSARAGMFARGEFDLGQTTALTVPQTAVVVRDGFNYLYRVNADSKVTQLKVQTGRILADRIEITSPLPPDTRLVASGGGFLNDGDLVKVVK